MFMRFLVALVACGFCAAHAAEPALLIKDVTLIDGTGAPPLEHASVLVIGERIASISPSAIKAPKGATVVNGKGKFLMPGLINTHIHLPGGRAGQGNRQLVMNVEAGTATLHAMLYSGVTAMYDSGNHDNYIFKMREDERAGRIQGPRVYATGRLLTKAYQCCSGGLQVTTYEETLKPLDALLARKPDMVKFTRDRRGMSPKGDNLEVMGEDVMAKLVNHVHEAGIPVTVHVSDEQVARESIAAGVDALAHPVYLERADQSFAKIVAAKRLPVSTTLGRADTDMKVFDQPIFVATINEEDRAELKTNPMYNTAGESGSWRAGLLGAVKKNIKDLYDAGAVLAMGTDRSMGAYVHREMELLSESGVPNLAITRIATLNAAMYMQKDKDIGSIERGKLADLLLLDADPVADIHNTVKINAVYKGGVKIDRAGLNVPINHKK